MTVNSLKLHNFRNFQEDFAEFSTKLNIIYGNNAMGKTNLLEAIFVCCLSKSPRALDKELIKFDSQHAKINLSGQNKYGSLEIEVLLANKKSISVDGFAIKRTSELLSNIICLYFSPDQLKLVKDAPESRRRFLDTDISQIYKIYYNSLTKYNQILTQRNNLLKKASLDALREMLPVWDIQLATEGLAIKRFREQFLSDLQPFASGVHDILSNNKEELLLEYSTSLANIDDPEAYCELLQNNLEKDLNLKFTSVGIHRDDIKIMLNGKDVRTFGSQGQQRCAALSMIIGEGKLIEKLIGETPVLILDDVFSELDPSRQKNLLTVCRDIQTFISCAEQNEEIFKEEAKFFCVENGRIVLK